jgi:transcriptional regulator with XRE-family HTH domain
MLSPMGGSIRAVDEGERRGRQLLSETGREIRDARLAHGLSQSQVARAAGLGQSRLSLIERGRASSVSLLALARLHAVLGLELSVKSYPGGQPMRDVAHLALLARLRSRVSPDLKWRTEVPLPIANDKRSWDACIQLRDQVVGIEAETRLRDLQAIERRLALKKRDGRLDRVLLLLADTRWNRAIVREHGPRLASSFPVSGTATLEALAAGRDPGGDAIVLL